MCSALFSHQCGFLDSLTVLSCIEQHSADCTTRGQQPSHSITLTMVKYKATSIVKIKAGSPITKIPPPIVCRRNLLELLCVLKQLGICSHQTLKTNRGSYAYGFLFLALTPKAYDAYAIPMRYILALKHTPAPQPATAPDDGAHHLPPGGGKQNGTRCHRNIMATLQKGMGEPMQYTNATLTSQYSSSKSEFILLS